MDEFKKWLHTVCFQAPPAHSYDLAKDAWVEAQKQERERIIALLTNPKKEGDLAAYGWTQAGPMGYAVADWVLRNMITPK